MANKPRLWLNRPKITSYTFSKPLFLDLNGKRHREDGKDIKEEKTNTALRGSNFHMAQITEPSGSAVVVKL